MEQGRLFLAIILSLIIFISWDYFFVEKPEGTGKNEGREQEQLIGHEKLAPQKDDILKEKTTFSERQDLSQDEKIRKITIETPLIRVLLSERGAVFKSVVLKDYKVTIKEDSEQLELISDENSLGTVLLGFDGDGLKHMQEKKFTAQNKTDFIAVRETEKELIFSYQNQDGVRIEKTYIFHPDRYTIGYKIKIINGSERVLNENMLLSLLKHSPEQKRMYGFEGPSAYVGEKLKQIKISKIEENAFIQGDIKWVTLQDRYFMSSLFPENKIDTGMKLDKNSKDLIKITYIQPINDIRQSESKVFSYTLYFGPKSLAKLKEVGNELDKAVNFGFFDILAKPCLWVMNFIYGIIPNYGLAIIFLTLMIKIILWPLGTKSYKSMAEMKKVQPIMKEIREKHKDDKQKMNEEIMGLYKTYKINPLGGCLPMVVQIPVFFALYRMLYEAIELRHAPFFGWIKDLSAPDRLFDFGITIPFMEPPAGIPVLTIIMGATMFLQQKMSPPIGDPAQAKMMMMMPIVFTVIFVNFSSGLVLYWLINNVFSISQQYLTQKAYK